MTQAAAPLFDTSGTIKKGSPKPSKRSRSLIGLKAWLEETKANGAQPIPDDDPVFDYARDVGIPREFLLLAWHEFKHAYTQPDAKRQKDWRAHFRNAVRKNWYHLWYLKGDEYQLTTVGLQAQRAHMDGGDRPREAGPSNQDELARALRARRISQFAGYGNQEDVIDARSPGIPSKAGG